MRTRTAARPESTRSFTPVLSPLLQRKCARGNSGGLTGQCSECQSKKLQRKAADRSDVSEVPPIVHEVLRSPGQPLEAETQTLMQSRLGHDLKSVLVHTDDRAPASAQAVNAAAYTVGDRMVFGAGQYAPRTPSGQRLSTHELIHVLQQRSLPISPSGSLKVGRVDDSLEHQANQIANQVTDPTNSMSATPKVYSTGQPSLQRQRLQTISGISTPQPANTRARRDGSVSYMVNGVRVTFLPDIDDPSIGHKAGTTIHFSDFAIDAQTRGDRVSSFTGPGAVEVTIQTVYGRGLSATSTSAYGRGTTTSDQRAGNTSAIADLVGCVTSLTHRPSQNISVGYAIT